MLFLSMGFFPITDRERARFEAVVRLENTTHSDNRRRPNENLPTVLEKHVSEAIFHFI